MTNNIQAKAITDLLAESKTHVGVVLNKRREYMPKRLRETV